MTFPTPNVQGARFAGAVRLTVMEMLTELGLTSGLELCLDAADASSYSGSGSTWNDVSGNGRDATLTGPTFHGTAGGKSSSEYFSFDGNDYGVIPSDSWVSSIHHDNALFTLLVVYYGLPNSTYHQILCASAPYDSSTEGFIARRLATSGGGYYNFTTRKAGGGSSFNVSGSVMPTNAWVVVGTAVNEGASTGHHRVGSSTTTLSPVYEVPASGTPTYGFQIGRGGGSGDYLSNGSRLAAIIGWSEELTATETGAVRTLLGTRYGW